MLKLKVVVGSTRPGRAADRVVPWIVARAQNHPAFDVEVLDLRDCPLPFVGAAFDADGEPTNAETEIAAGIMLDDLEWWGVALQRARAEKQLPPTGFRRRAAMRKAE